MKNYIKLINTILDEGVTEEHLNSTRISVYNKTLEFDMQKFFPIVSTKYTAYRLAINEMLWFMQGESFNSKPLMAMADNRTNIWAQWELKEDTDSYKQGDIGPMYGYLWRHWDGVDQLQEVIDDLKYHVSRKLTSTRFTITAFNPLFKAHRDKSPQENILDGKGCLNPCHPMLQFFLRYDQSGTPLLSLRFIMTSSDVLLGLPFNIVGYATMLEVIAKIIGAKTDKLYYSGGNVHIYENQLKGAIEYLEDVYKEEEPYNESSKLIFNVSQPITSIEDVNSEDIDIVNYSSLKVRRFKLTT